MAILRRIPWAIKPNDPEIDYSNQFAQSLTLLIENTGGIYNDLVANRQITVHNQQSIITDDGWGTQGDGNSSADIQLNTTLTLGTQYTIVMRCYFPFVNSITTWKTFLWAGSGEHPVLCNSANEIGIYNDSFFSSGIDTDLLLPGLHTVVAYSDSTQTRFNIDGIYTGVSSSSNTNTPLEYLLNHSGTGQQIEDPVVFIGLMNNRMLNDAEAKCLAGDGYQLFSPRKILIPASATTGVSVAPSTGTIEFVGNTPTITVETTLTPTTGIIEFLGYTPTVDVVTVAIEVAPTTGVVEFVGNTPNITVEKLLTPSTGIIEFVGYTPTIDIDTGAAEVVPTTGEIELVGNTPTVTVEHTLFPTTGVIEFTGNTPSVSAGAELTLNPETGLLEFVGYTPTIEVFTDIWIPVSTQTSTWTNVSEASSTWSAISSASTSWTNI